MSIQIGRPVIFCQSNSRIELLLSYFTYVTTFDFSELRISLLSPIKSTCGPSSSYILSQTLFMASSQFGSFAFSR